MRKSKKWLSGLLAVAASLLLLTGCGEGYYGEGPFEYSDASATVWEESEGQSETGQKGEGQGETGQEGKGQSETGQENEGDSRSGERDGESQSYREEDAQDADSSDENQMASGDTWDDWEKPGKDTDSVPDDRKPSGENQNDPAGPGAELDEYGVYTSMEDVALYLYTYEELPDNFITKKEARALGWEGGSLDPYAPGMCIGGDYFGNYEGNLPEEEGREYHECDIDTLGARSRGAKRIVYSNDGLIYYTEDHYETFTLLYGE